MRKWRECVLWPPGIYPWGIYPFSLWARPPPMALMCLQGPPSPFPSRSCASMGEGGPQPCATLSADATSLRPSAPSSALLSFSFPCCSMREGRPPAVPHFLGSFTSLPPFSPPLPPCLLTFPCCSMREGRPTAVSHGLWLNIPDYDAPTQMVKPRERNTRYVNAVMTVPKVDGVDVCGAGAGVGAVLCTLAIEASGQGGATHAVAMWVLFCARWHLRRRAKGAQHKIGRASCRERV